MLPCPLKLRTPPNVNSASIEKKFPQTIDYHHFSWLPIRTNRQILIAEVLILTFAREKQVLQF